MPDQFDPRPHTPQETQAVQHSLAVYRRIAVAFLLLTMLVIGLVLYVVLARAKVVVLSRQDDIQSDFIIDIAREPGPGEVHGDVLETSDVLTRSFPATASAEMEGRAEGRVRITSSLSRPQALVATTRLLTPGDVLYRISENVIVPANGSVEVGAYADVPGKAGETAHATFTIPGLNPSTRELFAVESVTPFTGGLRTVQAVTQEDVDKAAAVLVEELRPALEAKLDAMAAAKGLPTVGDGRTVQVTVLSATPSAKPGSEVKEFSMTVEARATGLYFDNAQFAKQVESRLRDLIGFDQSLLSATEDASQRSVEKRDLVSGRANVRVKARGIAILSAEAPALDPEKLVGISTDAAEAYLESVEGVSSASVSTTPFWSGRMPTVADHITVEVR
jgi:hypothetical protein